MSLALRSVARRADNHADTMQPLEATRHDRRARGRHLRPTIGPRVPGPGPPPRRTAAIQAECDDCTRDVRGYEADLDTWATDLIAEEEGMREAFNRVLTLDQVERRYGGVTDPADAALASKPGRTPSPEEVNAWWDGLTREQQQAIIAASPGSIGNLDGIPPEARDAANTVALDRDLADWELLEERGLLTDDEERWLENARAAEDAIDTIAGRRRPGHR